MAQIQNPIRLFNAVTLTSAFSGNVSTVVSTAGTDQVTFYGNFTPGTNGDNVDIQLEFSHDGSTWYVEQAASTSGGTTTVVDNIYTRDGAAAATSYKFRFTLPVSDKHMRVSARYTGTGAGTLSLHVLTSELYE